MTVEFVPGYYEWNLIVNGEQYYTYDDLSEEISKCDNKRDIQHLVNDLIYIMQEDKEIVILNEEDEDKISDTMLTAICEVYNIY